VKISLYYESLCPNSQYFVTSQFYPNWEYFGSDLLQIEFRPFGKANFSESDDGGWDFQCQHGPDECLGNKLQACALQQVTDPSEYIPLINCIMASEYPPLDGYSCLETLGITTTSLDDLVQCVESEQGEFLLHEIGVETLNLEPTLTGVPWLLFNDEFTMDDWIDGMNDLRGLLCSKYLNGTDKCLEFAVKNV